MPLASPHSLWDVSHRGERGTRASLGVLQVLWVLQLRKGTRGQQTDLASRSPEPTDGARRPPLGRGLESHGGGILLSVLTSASYQDKKHGNNEQASVHSKSRVSTLASNGKCERFLNTPS
jgi:hypothetical protein